MMKYTVLVTETKVTSRFFVVHADNDVDARRIARIIGEEREQKWDDCLVVDKSEASIVHREKE